MAIIATTRWVCNRTSNLQENDVKMLKVVKSRRVVAMLLAFAMGTASAAMMPQDMSDEAIAERIKAIGKVKLAGEEDSSQQASADGPRSGQAVYDKFCMACHTSGALGAPKINVAADWEARLEQGMDTVFDHAWEGFNAMPPKGTCNDCSEEEIQAAIDYMIADI